MSSTNDTSLGDSTYAMPFVETVDEAVDDGLDDAASANESLGANSFASGAADSSATVHVRDLLRMFGDTYCRVLMTQGRVPRVCGRPYGQCSRHNHNSLCLDPNRRGSEGFYSVYINGQGFKDGVVGRHYTQEEVTEMELAEVAEVAAGLTDMTNGFEDDPDVQDPPGVGMEEEVPTDLGGVPVGMPDPTSPEPVVTTPYRGRNTGPGGAPTARRGGGNRLDEQSPSTLSFEARARACYGFENLTTGDRILEDTLASGDLWLAAGWQVRKAFVTLAEGQAWRIQAVDLVAAQRAAAAQRVAASDGRTPRTDNGGRGRAGNQAPHGILRQPVIDLVSDPDLTQAPTLPTPRAHGTGTDPFSPPSQLLLYGMHHEGSGARIIASSREEADWIKDTGFNLYKIFRSRAAATAWETQTNGQGGARLTGESQERHQTRVGRDPSTGTPDIFGVNIDFIDQTDSACLPAGATGTDVDEYYDCATDVMALPGGYRTNDRDDDEDSGDVATALMTIATGRRETGIHMRYSAKTQHGLRLIKDASDLADFVEGVHEGWQHAMETMNSQFTRRMHKAGHNPQSITDYLQNGVLPRIIRDTYTAYAYFLTTLVNHINKMDPGANWKYTIARNFLRHHETKLWHIRCHCASYRELILRNYVYMRNQSADGFWNNKISKTMAEVTSTMLSNSALAAPTKTKAPAAGAAPGTTTGPQSQCTICHRAHSGRSPCPAAALTVQNRTKLGAGLRQRQYEKALKVVKELLDNDPSTPQDQVVDKARRAATAS